MGISYWWLECQCALNPSKIVRWAANCEAEARKERVLGNVKMAECLEGWAGQLRLHRPELFAEAETEP